MEGQEDLALLMAGSIAQQAPLNPSGPSTWTQEGKNAPECKAAIKATRPFFTAQQIPPTHLASPLEPRPNETGRCTRPGSGQQ
jgi:hypothetical protein